MINEINHIPDKQTIHTYETTKPEKNIESNLDNPILIIIINNGEKNLIKIYNNFQFNKNFFPGFQ